MDLKKQTNNINVSGQTNGTNMPPKSTESIGVSATPGTSEQLTLMKSPTTAFSAEASLARLSVLREKGLGSTTPEALSSMRSLGLQRTNDPDIYYLRMSKAYLVIKREKLSRQCLGFLPTLGIELNGWYLIPRTSGFRKTGRGSSLSDILETDPGEKYFLSEKATKKTL